MPELPAQLWRISNYDDLLGLGAMKAGARWNKPGQRMVYLAESPPGALLEILIHLELDRSPSPKTYQLLKIERASTARMPVSIDLLVDDLLDVKETQRAGESWLSGRETVLARVPSAIMPSTFNWLYNPLHPDANALQITQKTSHPYDLRLFGSVSLVSRNPAPTL